MVFLFLIYYIRNTTLTETTGSQPPCSNTPKPTLSRAIEYFTEKVFVRGFNHFLLNSIDEYISFYSGFIFSKRSDLQPTDSRLTVPKST